jgi:membrane-associated phospholipid phosphatase
VLNPLAPNRRLALLVTLGGWVLVLAIGNLVAGWSTAGPIDTALTHGLRAVVGNPTPLGKWAVTPPTVPTRILGAFSNPILVYAVIVALVVFALWRRRWELAGLAVLAPGVCVLFTELLKQLFDRQHSGYLAYPSGHMASSAAAVTVGALVLTGGWVGRRWKLAWGAWALVMVCTAAGLVAMNYHYPSDTIGGFCLAMGIVAPGAVIADTLGARRDERASRRRYATAPPVGIRREGIPSDSRRPPSPR